MDNYAFRRAEIAGRDIWAALAGEERMPMYCVERVGSEDEIRQIWHDWTRTTSVSALAAPALRREQVGRDRWLFCTHAPPRSFRPLPAAVEASSDLHPGLYYASILQSLLELAMDLAASPHSRCPVDPRFVLVGGGRLVVLAPALRSDTGLRRLWVRVLEQLGACLSTASWPSEIGPPSILTLEPEDGPDDASDGRVFERELGTWVSEAFARTTEFASVFWDPRAEHDGSAGEPYLEGLRRATSRYVDRGTSEVTGMVAEGLDEAWQEEVDRARLEYVAARKAAGSAHEERERLREMEHRANQAEQRELFRQQVDLCQNDGVEQPAEPPPPKDYVSQPFDFEQFDPTAYGVPATRARLLDSIRLKVTDLALSSIVVEEPAAGPGTSLPLHERIERVRAQLGRTADPFARAERYGLARAVVWTITALLMGSINEIRRKLAEKRPWSWWRDLDEQHIELLREAGPHRALGWSADDLSRLAIAVERWGMKVGLQGEPLVALREEELAAEESVLWDELTVIWGDRRLESQAARRRRGGPARLRLRSTELGLDRELPNQLFRAEEGVVVGPWRLDTTEGRGLFVGAPPEVPLRLVPFAADLNPPTGSPRAAAAASS